MINLSHKAKKEIFILLLILILGAFLRFWRIDKVPPSLNWDEAALGYNAFSLMKTGRDEYGQPLPLILRSFDDYKPAVYAYAAILPIKIFGLNPFAVRFPSAFFGTLSLFFVYLLVKKLFFREKSGGQLALAVSFLLAISPWHLQFSRAAFESNLSVFFNILIVYFFLKGLEKPWFFSLTALFSGLNLYVYQAEKVFAPFLALTLVLIWRRRLWKTPRRYLISAAAVGLLFGLPLIRMALVTPEVFLRAKGTSFASDLTPFLTRTVEKLIQDKEQGNYLGLFLDNRRTTYFLAFVDGYLAHFDFNWFFVTGDDARHHAPGMGLLYLWGLPFFLLGIYSLVFGKFDKRIKLMIGGWFLLAPLPAAFTSGVPHAIRAQRFLPTIQILVGLGLIRFWEKIKNEEMRLKMGLGFLGAFFFLFNFGYYLNQYFVQQNYFTSEFWQYGYREAVEKTEKIKDDYQKIVVSNDPHLDQSYIFFLFYLKYDPKTYQESGGTVSGGFAKTHGFGRFIFRPINWDNEEKSEKILYIGKPSDFHDSANVLQKVFFLNGEEAIYIVQGR